MIYRFVLLSILTLSIHSSFAQNEDSVITQNFPTKYLDNVSAKANSLEQKMDKKTDEALEEMIRMEMKMKKKLAKLDSNKAKEIFANAEQKYKELQEKIQSKITGKQYIASLDTLSTSLKFLEQNSQLIMGIKEGGKKLSAAMDKVNGLEDQFQKAEEIKKFLKERKEYLKSHLSAIVFAKEFKRINKQVYYYNSQINEYKAVLKDYKKAERKALELLSKTKLFKDFMRRNSMLASLFRMPGTDPNDPASQANLAGLQTRAQVNNLIQQQITAGGPNAQEQFRQNMQEAQSKLNELKNKINKLGGGSSNGELPEGFRPNNQKTKSFFKRLEYGTNIQTQKATYFFPVTSDIGLSIGYKPDDRSVIGIGASVKMGMGKGWNHIRVTHQGLGLRSFFDWKIKGSFWISGGYEQNYKTAFQEIAQLRDMNAWQQSGLIGLSKIVSLKTKFFKKTKLQLLWDFLSYQQIPKTQNLLFRVGYNIQ